MADLSSLFPLGYNALPLPATGAGAGTKRKRRRRGKKRAKCVRTEGVTHSEQEAVPSWGCDVYDHPGPPKKAKKTSANPYSRVVNHHPPLQRHVDFIQRPKPEVLNGYPGLSVTVHFDDEQAASKRVAPLEVASHHHGNPTPRVGYSTGTVSSHTFSLSRNPESTLPPATSRDGTGVGRGRSRRRVRPRRRRRPRGEVVMPVNAPTTSRYQMVPSSPPAYPSSPLPCMEEPAQDYYLRVEHTPAPVLYPHAEEQPWTYLYHRYPRVGEQTQRYPRAEELPSPPFNGDSHTDAATCIQNHRFYRASETQLQGHVNEHGTELSTAGPLASRGCAVEIKRETSPGTDYGCFSQPAAPSRHEQVVALDCEMVGCEPDISTLLEWQTKRRKRNKTREVSVAGRCTIVDYYGNVLYDSFIRPNQRITSLRTKYSGITANDMKRATPIDGARLEILEILQGKLVVAHHINNDLDALSIKLPPEAIRDTGFCLPLRHKANLNVLEVPSLKKLSRLILGQEIQTGAHCSCVDARITMQLYRCVEEEWERALENKFRDRTHEGLL